MARSVCFADRFFCLVEAFAFTPPWALRLSRASLPDDDPLPLAGDEVEVEGVGPAADFEGTAGRWGRVGARGR